jgi:protein-S-isoprenylcysteine O-methyltransferase Ste14
MSIAKVQISIAKVQIIRKAVLGVAILIGVLMFAFTASNHPSGRRSHEMIEWAGIAAIIVCILGRTWASLYIGGRKIEQFVTAGPYSVTRNPLYLFSIIGAAGAGAQLGSVLPALIFGLLAWIVFHFVVLQEERLLASRYGAEFEAYMTRVPRYLPNPKLWGDSPTLTVMPPRMLRTFADATVLLVSVPLAESFERLQNIGVLPVLLHLS